MVYSPIACDTLVRFYGHTNYFCRTWLTPFSSSVKPTHARVIQRYVKVCGSCGKMTAPGIILRMHPANEWRRYNVSSSFIGCAHVQNDYSTSDFIWLQILLISAICILFLLASKRNGHGKIGQHRCPLLLIPWLLVTKPSTAMVSTMQNWLMSTRSKFHHPPSHSQELRYNAEIYLCIFSTNAKGNRQQTATREDLSQLKNIGKSMGAYSALWLTSDALVLKHQAISIHNAD